MSEYPTLTEVVLKDPDNFPEERVNYHTTLAGGIFLGNPPPFRSDNEGRLELAPVTNPYTISGGAKTMCSVCSAEKVCKPTISIQPDNGIVIIGASVDSPQCKIMHPMPDVQTQSSTS